MKTIESPAPRANAKGRVDLNAEREHNTSSSVDGEVDASTALSTPAIPLPEALARVLAVLTGLGRTF